MEINLLESRHLIVMASFVANAIACGMCYGNSSFYYRPWMEEFGADKGLTASVGSISIGLLVLSGPLSSALSNYFGFRPVVILGGLVSSAGLLAAAFSEDIHSLMFRYGVIVGLGFGLSYSPAALSVTHYYPDKYHGLVMALSSSGVGFGHFITPVLAEFFSEQYSWRGSLIVQAALNLHLCASGALITPVPSMKPCQRTGGILNILKNNNYVIFLLHSFLIAFGVSVVLVHIGYGVETFAQVDSAQSSIAIALFGVFGGVGRLVHCIVAKLPAVNLVRYYLAQLLVGGVVLALFPLMKQYWSSAVCVSLLGYFLAVYGAAQTMILLCIVDLRNSLTGYGWANMATGIGVVSGAPVAGCLFDSTGNYAVSMWFGGGVILVSVMSMGSLAVSWKQNRLMTPPDRATIPDKGELRSNDGTKVRKYEGNRMSSR